MGLRTWWFQRKRDPILIYKHQYSIGYSRREGDHLSLACHSLTLSIRDLYDSLGNDSNKGTIKPSVITVLHFHFHFLSSISQLKPVQLKPVQLKLRFLVSSQPTTSSSSSSSSSSIRSLISQFTHIDIYTYIIT